MNINDNLINQFGIDEARYNIIKEISKLLNNSNKNEVRKKVIKLIIEKEKIEEGNIEIIKKYLREI